MELVIVQVVLLLITIVGMIVTIRQTKKAKSSYRSIEQLLKSKDYGMLQGIVGSINEMIEALEFRFRAMRNYWEHHAPDKTKPLGSTEPTEEELISTEAMRYQPLVKVAKIIRHSPQIALLIKDEHPGLLEQLDAALKRAKK